jgi:hypothetical protein
MRVALLVLSTLSERTESRAEKLNLVDVAACSEILEKIVNSISRSNHFHLRSGDSTAFKAKVHNDLRLNCACIASCLP